MPGKGVDLAASVLARLLNRAKQTGDDYQVLLSNSLAATQNPPALAT